MKTFEELLDALAKNNIQYILVGGLAVDLCGFSRATMDMDILVRQKKENLEALLECLESFGEGSAKELSIEDFPLEEGCIRIVEEFPLDIFTLMGGHTYEDLEQMTKTYTTESGKTIRFLNADGLIKLKSDSPRPKDKIDVLELKAIKNKNNS